MNQQQLQNARTALWRQNGQPLLTQDDAVAWLSDMGICLFLPRHAQLPAPGPSFVEACSGAARAVPAPAAIDAAMVLVTRLVAEKQAVPLNLMGTLTEQPDFLASPEALRWIAAVRGDRNWKAAPAGRTAPLVQRVWAALDQAPGRTAVEIREELGRELTEAAVMRALVELWTTLRAAPEYAADQPTRWSLMRDRYQQQLAAGANSAQTTALSALISLYLHQAIAASAEEAEIFLSPLTARSRIREVLHGMLATRQFGTMPLGVQTLLYLEGSLPEFAEETPAPAESAPLQAAEAKRAPEKTEREFRPPPRRAPRPEFRREQQPRREFRPGARRESRPEFRGPKPPRREFDRGPGREERPERGERREFQGEKKKPFRPGQKPEWRRGPKPGQGPEERREFRKPWQKGGEFRGPRKERPQGREFGERREQDRKFPRERKEGGWQAPRRPGRENQPRGEGRPERGPERREFQSGKRREFRPEGRERGPNRREFGRDNRERGQGRPEFRRGGAGKPKFSGKPERPGREDRPVRSGERQDRGFRKPGAKFAKPAGRFGKPGGARFTKPGNRFGKPGGGGRFGKPAGKRADSPRERRPWKNRPDKNGPKGPRSGKNRKEQKDQPE